ncbi:MAG: hypothetical protein ACI4NJ_04450 [Cellvibrio sp.]
MKAILLGFCAALLTACATPQTHFGKYPNVYIDTALEDPNTLNVGETTLSADIPPAVDDVDALLEPPSASYRLNCLVMSYLMLAKPELPDTDEHKFVFAGSYEKWTPIEGEPKRYFVFRLL